MARQANDAIASERSILAKIRIIKVFPCRGEQVRTYISGLDARGGRKLRTDRHTHTWQL